jgi:integrase
MPRRAKGPRLYFDPKRENYVIRDGSSFIRTGCSKRDGAQAEKLLAQYIGQKHRPAPSGSPLIAEVLTVYGSDVAPKKPSARNIGYHISNLLKWWGDKRVADITKKTCQAHVATKTAPAAAQDLKILRVAVKHWHEDEDYGPLDAMPIFEVPAGNPPKERWLTKSEAARLLRAAKPYQHLRRMILLCLHTGSRPGVCLSLRWDQIDLHAGLMSRAKRGEIQDRKKRKPKVKLGRKILGHVKRWKKIDGAGQELVCHFTSPWHPGAREVEDPHGAWAKVVKAAGLEGVTRHTLRHTRATWTVQKGVPLWEAAGFLGMTVKTLEAVYGHHSPDFQGSAADL